MSATVQVDREQLREVLVEAYSLMHVMEIISGSCNPEITDELAHKCESLGEAVFGSLSDEHGETVGPVRDIWEEGEQRARAWLRSRAGEAVTA